MSIPRQVHKKLRKLSPSALEAFRQTLEHGQPSWTPDDYMRLYHERPDLRARMCAYLGVLREPSRDWVPIAIAAGVGIAGIVVPVILELWRRA